MSSIEDTAIEFDTDMAALGKLFRRIEVHAADDPRLVPIPDDTATVMPAPDKYAWPPDHAEALIKKWKHERGTW